MATAGGHIWTDRGLIIGPEGLHSYSETDAAAVINRGWSGPEDAAEVWARAKRQGIRGLSPRQLLILVFFCLLTGGGLPVVQEYLPHGAQSVLTHEYATLSMALTVITAAIMYRKR
jgi:hypothetical protein